MNMHETMIITYISSVYHTGVFGHASQNWTKQSPKANMGPDFFRRTGYCGFLWQLKWQGTPQPALWPMQHQQTHFVHVFQCENFMY